MVKTKTKKSTKKVEYKQQEREVIAFCWVSHGTYTWSIGKDPNIIHATRCVRVAMGEPLTEKEKNATKKSQINPICPDLVNPSYVPY